jgi:hypothetical protein
VSECSQHLYGLNDDGNNKKGAVRRLFLTTVGEKLLLRAWNAETLVEAVNAATGSNITLLASVERVAFATYVQVQIMTHGRANLDNITA